jgi:mRNA interferase MazF
VTRSPHRGRGGSSGARQHRVPQRGDVVKLDFDPQKGREQAGRRPALVISPANYNNKTGLAVLCPITNQAKGYPYEVKLPEGLDTTGVILSDQIKSLDWRARNAEVVDRVPENLVAEVVENALTLLKPEDDEEAEG